MSKVFIHYVSRCPQFGRIVKLRSVSAAIVMLVCGVIAAPTYAAVNLELRPISTVVVEGSTLDVEIYAVVDSDVNEEISGLDMVITWDSSVLGAVEVVPGGGFNWNLGGNFMDDTQADNLNERLKNGDLVNDGDAYFQGATFSPAIATPQGLLVTTLRFSTVARGLNVPISIIESLGIFSRTKVLEFNSVNKEITGTLGTTTVDVLCLACLFVSDVKMLAGRESFVFVSGEIVNQSTLGVTVTTEILPGAESFGVINYTPAPPVDIQEVENPWLGVGVFVPFDTDLTFSDVRNGSVSDNGTFDPVLTTFAGVLSRFPVIADVDAEGTWNVQLEITGIASSWTDIATSLVSGTIQIVDPYDGDGDLAIDVLEFSRMQRCFTGPVGPVSPPVYDVMPGLDCGVYDWEGDGDIDETDYEQFRLRLTGPGISG